MLSFGVAQLFLTEFGIPAIVVAGLVVGLATANSELLCRQRIPDRLARLIAEPA